MKRKIKPADRNNCKAFFRVPSKLAILQQEEGRNTISVLQYKKPENLS